MNHLTTYLESPAVTLWRFDHPRSSPHRDPREEVALDYSINFLEKGRYSLKVGKRQWQMSHREVFITYPGLMFNCCHTEEFPEDVSFSVVYDRQFLRDQKDPEPLVSNPSECVVSLNNRLVYLHMRLKALTGGFTDVLTAETLAGELLMAVTGKGGPTAHRLHSGRQLAWYVERVEAARHLMETAYDDTHSLSSLARFTGMSPFHFARIFRELAGTPPHRFLMNVRLARSCQLLLDGVSVTETCFAVGFENLSHFIRLFRRTFGVSPSKFFPKKARDASN